VCALSYPIFKLLFPKEYLAGYIVAPYLFIAPLLLMLFQVVANQFLVIKKTWPNMLILILGAGSNIFFNYILIPQIGIEGAALGTLAGYIISLLIVCVVLTRMKLLVISERFLVSSLIMVIVMFVWRLIFSDRVFPSLLLAVAGCVIIMLLYLSDIKRLLSMLLKREGKASGR
jgi:O-antigen/teichoic acid export membrane protein